MSLCVCVLGCSGTTAPGPDASPTTDAKANCADVSCEHAPVCGRMNETYGCCLCEPGHEACTIYEDLDLLVTCRSDGLCYMPEACPPGRQCEQTGPATAACHGGSPPGDTTGDVVSDTSDWVGTCTEPCTQTPMCTDPNKPLCNCPCEPENMYCDTSGDDHKTVVCSQDLTCFEQVTCDADEICEETEEGPKCVSDPNALPPCRVDCIPPPLCGAEPENSNCPICECTDGDTFCDSTQSPAVLGTCEQEGSCVTITSCPAGDPCVYVSPQNGQCLSKIDECAAIAAAYLNTITSNQACDLDNQCVYQWGRCDMGSDQCYYGIHWETLNTLYAITGAFDEKNCQLSPPCADCSAEPTGGLCENGHCVPVF